MIHFKSWQSYRNFRDRITRRTRYILDNESQDFLDTLVATCQDRKHVIKEGAIFWRAQLGNDWYERTDGEGHKWEELTAHPRERMKPFRDKACEGRANPKGIPCLYLSTNKETAMSEVRPWVGVHISVSQFKIIKQLTIVDLSVHHSAGWNFYWEEPEPEERTRAVWIDVDRAFAEPVNTSDDRADYVPTQIIAERFKEEGLDGIAYKSAFGEAGYNIALFNPDMAECVNGFLFKAESINIEFKDQANPWFLSRKNKD